MTADDPAPDLPALLQRDYWLIRSTPHPTTTQDDIEQHAPAHVRWLLDLEAGGVLLMSGPLTSGSGVRAGSGVTVVRADDREEAVRIAAGDPFVLAGLRTFDVFGWRVNEGSISVRVALGTGKFDWH